MESENNDKLSSKEIFLMVLVWLCAFIFLYAVYLKIEILFNIKK